MKSIKSLLVAILVMVSSIAFADQSGCEQQYSTADGVYSCKRQWIQNTREHLFALQSRLLYDSNKLGLTDEESKSAHAYYLALEEDAKKRCGNSEFDCKYEVYAIGYNELKTFEDKKIQEKQARSSAVARPSFAPGKTQAVAKTQPASPAIKQSAKVIQQNEEEVGD